VAPHLYWHESTDQDPANRWMREQIIELCQWVTAQEKKLDKALEDNSNPLINN